MVSCAIVPEISEDEITNTNISGRTKSTNQEVVYDSLMVLSRKQSNPEFILYNSIYKDGDKYFLGLTLQEAIQLGISEELYCSFLSTLTDLN